MIILTHRKILMSPPSKHVQHCWLFPFPRHTNRNSGCFPLDFLKPNFKFSYRKIWICIFIMYFTCFISFQYNYIHIVDTRMWMCVRYWLHTWKDCRAHASAVVIFFAFLLISFSQLVIGLASVLFAVTKVKQK